MTDYPTVGLAVDLRDLDAGITKSKQLERGFDGVAVAADKAGKNIKAAMGDAVTLLNAAGAASIQNAAKTERSLNAETRARRAEANEAKRLHQERMNAIRVLEVAQRAAAASALMQGRGEEQQIKINTARYREMAAAAAAARAASRGGVGLVAPNDVSLLSRFSGALGFLRNGLREVRSVLFDVRTAFSVFLGAMVVKPIMDAADAMTALKARAGAFTDSASDVPVLMERIYQTAQDTRTPLEAIATLYTRLAPLAKQVGKSQLELLQITSTVAKGIQIGGATPAEAAASSQQLAQALASNRLGGDELRSLAENAPLLLNQIAKALGMNTGEFIKWAHAGKANTQVVLDALQVAAPAIDALFAKFPVTIGQSITLVKNAFQNLVGSVNDLTGASADIAAFIAQFAAFMDAESTVNALATAVRGLGFAFTVLVEIGKGVITFLPAIAALLLIVGTRALFASTAFVALGVAARAAAVGVGLAGPTAMATAVAMTGLGAAVTATGAAFGRLAAFLGGPVGIALIALAAGISYVRGNTLEFEEAATKATDAMGNTTGALARAISFSETYGISTEKMTNLMLKMNGVQDDQVRGLDAAGKAAYARAENERQLTVSLLNRAAADQLASAASLRRSATLDRVEQGFRGGAAATARFLGLKGGAAENQRRSDAARDLGDFKDNTAFGMEQSARDAAALAKELKDAKITLTTPDKAGVAQLSDTADKAKKAKKEVDALAESFKDFLQQQERNNEIVSNFKWPTPEDFDFDAAIYASTADQSAAALTRYSNLVDQVAAHTQNAARGMADAFGSVGEAIGGVAATLANYDAQNAAITARRAQDEASYARVMADKDATYGEQMKAQLDWSNAQEMASKELTAVRLKHYGDVTEAAKGFFKQGSTGYKIMEGAERGFRLFEFAMSAKSIAVKAVETGAKLGLYSAQTAAAVTAGAANMFATLGPFGFAAVGAMLAVMAAVGFKGGGSGAAPGAGDSVARQSAQGSGSVLGDSGAKSASIQNALALTTSYQNKDLEYGNAMTTSLRSIDNQIGVLANAVAQSLSATGALSTKGLGLGSSTNRGSALGGGIAGGIMLGPVGAVLGAVLAPLFSTKSTTTLQDQGLKFTAQSVGEILAQGVSGSTFQQVLTETKKKFIGITYSDKAKSSTINGDLDDTLTRQITGIIGSLRDGVLSAAGVLGVEGAQATLDAMEVSLGEISFKDMTGDEITETLNAVFSKLGDDFASTLLPGIVDLQKVGEGAFETLVRLGREYQVVDITMQSIGKTFDLVGVSSIGARDLLVELSGGLDQFTQQATFFAEQFLSEAERLAPIQVNVSKAMADLGYAGVTTREQFKDLVLGLDVTTEAGASLYAKLMQIAPGFDKVVDAAEAAQKIKDDQAEADRKTNLANAEQAVTDAEAALTQARAAEQQEIASTARALAQSAEATRSRFQAFANGFADFRRKLMVGELSGNDPMMDRDRARAEFLSTSALAQLGNEDALGRLQEVSEAYLAASKESSSSSLYYLRDLAEVKAAVESAEDLSNRQVSIAQQQLDVANAQLAQLEAVNDNILTVAQALANLNAAKAALAVLQGGGGGVGVVGGKGGSVGPSPTYNGPNDNNGDGVVYTRATVNADDVARVKAALNVLDDPSNPMKFDDNYYQYLADLERAGQLDPGSGTSKALAAAGFALGGDHPGGLRIVGEEGPEIEATGASRIYSNRDTKRMLGNDNSEVVDELRRTNQRLDDLISFVKPMAGDVENMERIAVQVTEDGTGVVLAEEAA